MRAHPPTGRDRPVVRGRLVRVLVAFAGLALLAVAVTGAVGAGRQAARDELDHALLADASSGASALQEYFDRAYSVNLLLAHDSAFRQFEARRAEVPPVATPASVQAAEAMAYLEELYPGRISEACLIDASGTELARVVEGQVAPAEDLSTEEAAAPFFAPTMRLPEGRVHQAAPYVSPDTDEWVISNSTPMVAGGRTWGLVHFEVALTSFRPGTGETGAVDAVDAVDAAAAIVDTRTGEVVLAGGEAFEPGALGAVPRASLLALTADRSAPSTATVGEYRLTAVPVAVASDNANRWAVVAIAPADAKAWYRSVGVAPISMAVAAALLLLLAGMSLRASQREVHAASLTDHLTGLPNRRLLADRLAQALLLSRRRGATCAVMLIDLDRFKEVNDTLGHQHGDELLRGVATRMLGVLRESDTVARLGGDEFAVLMPEVAGEAAAVELAQRCRAALHEPFLVDGIALSVEASVGVALSPQHAQDAEALMRAVDVAMYQAKERKGGVVVYDPTLDVHAPTRLALLGDLRRALQRDELVLHYQPKVDLATDDVRSVEALVRWHHPERGLVPPADFVPLAEGTGLILPLTLRTLDLAVAKARGWLDGGRDVQIAVNLSPRCLLDPEFAVSVRGILDRHGLPARLLRMEITETAVVIDPARAMLALAELRACGVALSIDDFGTGYSSMSYLKRLPVDELKIDRSFVADMLTNDSDMVLVRSCIDLGHNLGMTVVAEGVEDSRTLAALNELGCDVVQGYHLARPMTADDTDAWLSGRDERTGVPAGAAVAATD